MCDLAVPSVIYTEMYRHGYHVYKSITNGVWAKLNHKNTPLDRAK